MTCCHSLPLSIPRDQAAIDIAEEQYAMYVIKAMSSHSPPEPKSGTSELFSTICHIESTCAASKIQFRLLLHEASLLQQCASAVLSEVLFNSCSCWCEAMNDPRCLRHDQRIPQPRSRAWLPKERSSPPWEQKRLVAARQQLTSAAGMQSHHPQVRSQQHQSYGCSCPALAPALPECRSGEAWLPGDQRQPQGRAGMPLAQRRPKQDPECMPTVTSAILLIGEAALRAAV